MLNSDFGGVLTFALNVGEVKSLNSIRLHMNEQITLATWQLGLLLIACVLLGRWLTSGAKRVGEDRNIRNGDKSGSKLANNDGSASD